MRLDTGPAQADAWRTIQRSHAIANGREGSSGERMSRFPYFVFEKNAFSFGPVSALWRMMPSQPAW